MGSGNHARTYLHPTERGELIELPLAWYSENNGTWAMNPGHDRAYLRAPSRTGACSATTYLLRTPPALISPRAATAARCYYFERSVYLKPDDAEIRINYAVTLAGLDRLPDARRQIDAALKADPKSREANNFLGTLLENTGPRDEALNEFLRAAQLRPDFGLAHWNVTRVLSAKGDGPRRDYNSSRPRQCGPRDSRPSAQGTGPIEFS